MWETNDPLGHQHFLNSQFGDDSTTIYKCGEPYFRPVYTLFNYGFLKSLCVNLDATKTKAFSTVYPNMAKFERCTVMLLSNLAESDWIQINCELKLLANILCVSEPPNHTNIGFIHHSDMLESLNCAPGYFSKYNLCYIFLWHNAVEIKDLTDTCKRLDLLTIDISKSNAVQYLFEAVEVPFPPIIFTNKLNKLEKYKVQYVRYLNIYRYKKKVVVTSDAQGFQICRTKKHSINTGSNVFSCKSGQHMSYLYVCDGFTDCPNDNSDEMVCGSAGNQGIAREKGRCAELYYRDYRGSCSKYVNFDKEDPNISNKTSRHVCNNNLNMDIALVNDLVADCGPEAEDEPVLTSFLWNKRISNCERPNEIPCIKGHSRCYDISFICLYQLDKNNHNFPYRNGAHLANCKDFECNLKFKCVELYCIPWEYVCDGKWDCANEDDEMPKLV